MTTSEVLTARGCACLLASALLLLACGDGALTKGKAAELIRAHEGFGNQNDRVVLTNEGFKQGLERGYWTKGKQFVRITDYELTDKAKSIFTGWETAVSVVDDGDCMAYASRCALQVTLHPSDVEVTSISEMPMTERRVKAARFTCALDVPQELKGLIQEQSGECRGEATFELHDDGWKVATLLMRAVLN